MESRFDDVVARLERGNHVLFSKSKPASYWTSLISWIHKGNMSITSKEDGILSYATKIPHKIPSDKQSEVIIRIEKKAVESGFSG